MVRFSFEIWLCRFCPDLPDVIEYMTKVVIPTMNEETRAVKKTLKILIQNNHDNLYNDRIRRLSTIIAENTIAINRFRKRFPNVK